MSVVRYGEFNLAAMEGCTSAVHIVEMTRRQLETPSCMQDRLYR
jgi:hypothetical protein